MATITRKQIGNLMKMANHAAIKAIEHEKASKRFYDEFEKLTGVPFDCVKDGSEDPIVDVVEYGTSHYHNHMELYREMDQMLQSNDPPVILIVE